MKQTILFTKQALQLKAFIKKQYTVKIMCIAMLFFIVSNQSFATNYHFTKDSLKTRVQSKLNTATAGDTITLENGTYANWGKITFTNANGNSPTANMIVFRAATPGCVVFTGNAAIQFGGYRIQVEGFRFANFTNPAAYAENVIAFASSTSSAFYSRVTNITIDNYNISVDTIKNNWVTLKGKYNRLDHCTFINKSNQAPTVEVVYDSINTTLHAAPSTYHLIDSNYFNGRSFQGANEGESIRVGLSTSCRTKGYNVIEYNLFENGTAAEPEIVSNKSCYNTYRYNTFKNFKGGLTLRQGRYCTVNGNFFLVTNSATECYGIRIFDRGHRVYNNYLEGLNGNVGSLSTLKNPISICNGDIDGDADIHGGGSGSNANSAKHYSADSCLVVFNSVVNCYGGPGIVIGYVSSSSYTYVIKDAIVNYNIVKMLQGYSAYIDDYSTVNSGIVYLSKGNLYSNAYPLLPTTITGFAPYKDSTYPYGFGTTKSADSIFPAPNYVRNLCVRSEVIQPGSTVLGNITYQTLVNNQDISLKTRGGTYDTGCDEFDDSNPTKNRPLNAANVGATSSGCGARFANNTVKSTTSSLQGIQVYPNPASSFINISLGDVNNIKSIRIVNAMGSVVKEISSKNTSNNISIPVNSYSAGLYFIQIETANEKISRSIIINKTN